MHEHSTTMISLGPFSIATIFFNVPGCPQNNLFLAAGTNKKQSRAKWNSALNTPNLIDICFVFTERR